MLNMDLVVDDNAEHMMSGHLIWEIYIFDNISWTLYKTTLVYEEKPR